MTNVPDPDANTPARSRLARAKKVAFIVVPVLVIAVGAVFAIRTFASGDVCAAAIPDAATTVATASGVDSYRIGSDREKRYAVEYSYEVDGSSYVARGRDFKTASRANRFAEQEPTATAHYDPERPSVACVSYEK